ncbi:protein adenylyltransferase SelO family protein [Magnetovibrio sp.]|uniref:protein adenylyltransferase SelO family protein n=1 Tax=Magnetovibrio sp. TaxID=2024836 RepID=UPI002F9240BD
MRAPSKYTASQTHLDLGPRFFQPVPAAQFPKHELRFRNQRWAHHVGLDDLNDDAWVDHFAQFKALPDNLPEPIALAYHGHQFRHYNPDLGDGRGFLFAQLRDPLDGRLLDLGTKGSGRTPWSRGGDGKLTLKGAVREILATEMLEALGVDTSKTFSVVETGEALTRGDEPSPTRSAVLVRLSHGHVRIGSFQRHAYHQDLDAIETLARHVAKHYLTDIDADAPMAELSVELVRRVATNTARTAADWTAAGFVHGVLNTDNINVTGESFDYGPWRFLPQMDPNFTAAYFDDFGLYAFGRQPEAVLWNVSRLAECFAPFAAEQDLSNALAGFDDAFNRALNTALSRRFGIDAQDGKRLELGLRLFPAMHKAEAPFEQVFFDCYGGTAATRKDIARQTYADGPLKNLVRDLATCAPADGITPDHAYFQGDRPCTMLIDEVEHIWDAIAQNDDWSRLEQKLAAIAAMRAAYEG